MHNKGNKSVKLQIHVKPLARVTRVACVSTSELVLVSWESTSVLVLPRVDDFKQTVVTSWLS